MEPERAPFFLSSMSEDLDKLFKANFELAKQSMGHRLDDLDWDEIKSRRDICRSEEKKTPWTVCEDNVFLFPHLIPRTRQVADHYSNLIAGLKLGNGIEQYIDVHARDIHLFDPLVQLYHHIRDADWDPSNTATTTVGYRPYFLVAFGTGSGETLAQLCRTFRPHHLVIALSDWQDFATSFWHINWKELDKFQTQEIGGKLTVGCYKSSGDLLSFMNSECLAGIDHALLYLPPKDSCSSDAIKLRNSITNVELEQAVTYLGYTIDEHNMVWNSWKTLTSKPRVYQKPLNPLGGRMIVCGSGPSLDANIEYIREYSKTHWITACGSKFSTLKANNIRVDFLSLVERADAVLEDVKTVVEEFGAGKTRVFMSTTCHHELLSHFDDGMVYFRPALTPLSLFSNKPAEVLNFEGPESINSGIAFATSLGISEIILVGVDLGADHLKN